ncbi:probable serine/threonine-protein kinase irlD [Sebastes umbrosus]|uniref:probable serine/threonine-protein kinase irlD n=1 Tax=Sebastes umbrosus TaxID=72105 RepID=UPI0018A0BE07|nr:probable serine/threonine-protein kinase irlD [Sebastes umbrosus]
MGQALLLPSSTELVTKFLKIEKDWEEKYEALTELSENLVMREEIREKELQQLEDDNKDLKDKLDLAEKDSKQQAELQWKVSQLEQQMHQRDAEVLDLIKQKTSLSEKLTETRKMLLDKRDELVDCEETWDLKYRRQNVNFYKILEEKNQFYMTKIKQLLDDNENLVYKYNKDLAENSQSWASTVIEMHHEKTLLEDICLDMKKKMRGFFSCSRTVDRETMLTNMKSKMLKSRMVKVKEKQEAGVEQGAQQDEMEETKEPEKKKKGFLSWMFRKKMSDWEGQVQEFNSCWATVERSYSTATTTPTPSTSTSPSSLNPITLYVTILEPPPTSSSSTSGSSLDLPLNPIAQYFALLNPPPTSSSSTSSSSPSLPLTPIAIKVSTLPLPPTPSSSTSSSSPSLPLTPTARYFSILPLPPTPSSSTSPPSLDLPHTPITLYVSTLHPIPPPSSSTSGVLV